MYPRTVTSSSDLYQFDSFVSFSPFSLPSLIPPPQLFPAPASTPCSLDEPVNRAIALAPTAHLPLSFQPYESIRPVSSPLAGKSGSVTGSIEDSINRFNLKSSAPSAAAVVVPVELKDEPVYIERYTSFYSTSPVSELFSALSQSLNRRQCDYSMLEEKAKFRCIAYDHFNHCIQFVIRIYRAKKDKSNSVQSSETLKVIELQRRSGCSVAFNRIVQLIREDIKPLIVAPYVNSYSLNGSVHPLDGHSALPLPVLPYPCPRLDAAALESLCKMAKSNDISAARESIRALSTCQFTEFNAQIDRLIDVIVTVLTRSAQDSEQVRPVAVMLANLAAQEQTKQKLLLSQQLVVLMLNLLDQSAQNGAGTNGALCGLQERDTKRQLAQTFATLSATHAAELANAWRTAKLDYMSTLRKYVNAEDERLGGFVRETLQRVAAVQ